MQINNYFFWFILEKYQVFVRVIKYDGQCLVQGRFEGEFIYKSKQLLVILFNVF